MATAQEGTAQLGVPPLTVIEEHGQRGEIKKGSTSFCYGVVKAVVAVFVYLSLLFCLVASKISVLVISQDLTEGNGTEKQFQTHLDADGRLSMLMLLLIFLVPYVVTFLWCLWSSGVLFTMAGWLCCRCYSEENNMDFGFKPWPTLLSFTVGFVSSVLEVGGLWILVTTVYTHATGITSVLMGTFAFTAYNAWNILDNMMTRRNRSPNPDSNSRSRCPEENVATILAIVAFVLNIVGLVVITVYAIMEKSSTSFGQLGTLSWSIAASVACFSLAWFPGILKYQSTASRSANKSRSMANSPRWKAGLLTNMEKIVLTPLTLYLFGLYYSHDDDFIRAVYENQGYAWVTGLREHRLFWYFMTNVLTSFSAYVLTWLATALDIRFVLRKRHISMAFVPMALATPLSAFVVGFYPVCNVLLPDYQCDQLRTESSTVNALVLVCLFAANFISVGVWLAMNDAPKISKETRLFWLPTYNGILTEQWLWLNRRTGKNDPHYKPVFLQRKECQIYICTTMYNESEEEMRQLLTSIKNVVDNRDENSPRYHSHIWLDGAFDTKRKKSKHLNANALHLLSLMRSVFEVEFESNPERNIGFERHDTPYGLQLVWGFFDPHSGQYSMSVVLHLKDNQKVKNKKRWSQIMYLSYIVDLLSNKPRDESDKAMHDAWEDRLKKTFILATDADVKFTLDSVEALFDVFLRDDDHSVSAVCGRTHPLGSKVQPIVSYQVFDYAIGHWLQKVANHVLGSVLCAPGCFTMYRTSVLKRTMAEYASDAKTGFEFLYKDMGEDRWLCTLLVKNRSGIEYCAVAEDKTFCPETFGEFFKQRRRWIVSTMANMWLLLKSAEDLVTSSERITYPFMIYQFFLLVSSLIGPATVILVISGGLEYAFGINDIAISLVLVVVALLFLSICMYTSNETQINVAIGASAIFAIVMAVTFIGTIRQVVQDFSTFNLTYISSQISVTELPVPVSSLYVCAVAGMFVITALLHPTEFTCLFHGITYLFFLPAGFLFLTIYSICNITDQSWGTREAKTSGQEKSALQEIWDRVQGTCCPTQKNTPEFGNVEMITNLPDEANDTSAGGSVEEEQEGAREDRCHDAISVKNWLSARFLQNEIKACEDNFKKLGYDDTTFIAGMSKEEIRQVGIMSRDHVNLVHAEVQRLPAFQIDPQVPTDTAAKERWITSIGLVRYRKALLDNFDDLMTTTDKDQLRIKYGIHKPGHLKRLYKSIQQLRPATLDEASLMKVREKLKSCKSYTLTPEVRREKEFWKNLIDKRLKPSAVFKEKEDALKNELLDLRKTALMWFAVVNTLWLTIFLTLGNLGTDPEKPDLQLFGNNPLGLVFLFIFCFLLIVQFLAMLCHRLLTFVHLLARATLGEGNGVCCCPKLSRNVSSGGNGVCCCQRTGDPEQPYQTLRDIASIN
ncbi:uncharacterized protein LOC106175109 [Lingula anatina]|uniref:chitin synthase n=1 Tax=Lingula anatina TaxID=7574 RepID=A0A1S3JQH3_LINAN|nr:uncharacterized protein LOC106175109 [Lingula anatina]|eukprot:XP_013412401.1 uncharacterized protein LOC106175109 [Lingula anatina]